MKRTKTNFKNVYVSAYRYKTDTKTDIYAFAPKQGKKKKKGIK